MWLSADVDTYNYCCYYLLVPVEEEIAAAAAEEIVVALLFVFVGRRCLVVPAMVLESWWF